MFDTLYQDFQHKAIHRELPPTKIALFKLCFCEGSTAQIIYRAMRFCQTHHLSLLAMLLYRLNAHLSHVVSGRGADIGPGLVIMHSFGIVINSSVRAGRNLVLEHGVTIGSAKGQSPILG